MHQRYTSSHIHARQAVRELIETEKTYVNGLKLCIDTYYAGLAQDAKVVSADDLKGMFNDMQTIHQLNETFLRDLQQRYSGFNNDKTRIGDQFVKFCPYFRMYQNCMLLCRVMSMPQNECF